VVPKRMVNHNHKYFEIELFVSQNFKFSGNQYLLDAVRNRDIAIFSSQNNIGFMLYKSFGNKKLNVANSLEF
jgi:hypothetical protein